MPAPVPIRVTHGDIGPLLAALASRRSQPMGMQTRAPQYRQDLDHLIGRQSSAVAPGVQVVYGKDQPNPNNPNIADVIATKNAQTNSLSQLMQSQPFQAPAPAERISRGSVPTEMFAPPTPDRITPVLQSMQAAGVPASELSTAQALLPQLTPAQQASFVQQTLDRYRVKPATTPAARGLTAKQSADMTTAARKLDLQEIDDQIKAASEAVVNPADRILTVDQYRSKLLAQLMQDVDVSYLPFYGGTEQARTRAAMNDPRFIAQMDAFTRFKELEAERARRTAALRQHLLGAASTTTPSAADTTPEDDLSNQSTEDLLRTLMGP